MEEVNEDRPSIAVDPEELNRWLLDGLDAISSFFNSFQPSDEGAINTEEYLNGCQPLLLRFIDFTHLALYIVDETGFDFQLGACFPKDQNETIQKAVDHCIEEGTFSWALSQQRLVDVPLDNKTTVHMHVLSTRKKTIGMFVGLTENDLFISDATRKFVSLLLMNCANTMESYGLYKALQDYNLNLEDKIAERTKELIKSEKEARDANAAKSQFLSNTSHEIRTPLNAIIGYSEMLMEDLEDTEYVQDLEKILTSARHQLGIINEILDFSKAESGQMELDLREMPVPPILEQVEAVTKPLCAKNNNQFVLENNIPKQPYLLDNTKLKQILINVISNAAKFTRNGSVTLHCQELSMNSKKILQFEIKDTGIGMTVEQQGKIFEPFKQAEQSTTRNYGGTGLGLAICKSYCELMRGSITVQSEPEKGSVFTIQIPADGLE